MCNPADACRPFAHSTTLISAPLHQSPPPSLVPAVGVLAAALCVRGIHYDGALALFTASLLLGLLNAFIRPLLLLLAWPLLFLTLGLLLFFINAALLYFVGQVIKGFYVESFRAAF